MGNKQFPDIGAALVLGDRATAASAARAVLTNADTIASRAGIARQVSVANARADLCITLTGFGQTAILTDALSAYCLCSGRLVKSVPARVGAPDSNDLSMETIHLVRLPGGSDAPAFARRLDAYPPGRVFIVPDPGIRLPLALSHFEAIDTENTGMESSWIDDRRLGEELAMLTPGAACTVATLMLERLSATGGGAIKMILTDLDDTLWGGIVGEDGVDGLTMSGDDGRDFGAYQTGLARLSRQGVLLAAISRNRADDVAAVFATRRDLNVSSDDFLAIEASWQPKADTIRRLLDRAQVAPEAAVFIDNDPLERALVRDALPGLLVPEDGHRPAECLARLEAKGRFAIIGSAEDRKRSQSTRASIRLGTALKSGASRNELLASLGMHLTFEDLDAENRPRALQLAERVTQFRTGASPKPLVGGGRRVFLVRLTETGIDHGRVGLVIWHTRRKTAVIDLICLSCRALNRNVETAMLAETARRADQLGLDTLEGQIMEMPRNAPARDLYLRHGFTRTASGLFCRDLSGITAPFYLPFSVEAHSKHDHS